MTRPAFVLFSLTFLAACFVGCQRKELATTDDSTALTRVQLQLDWFPEPAHGGFFQADAKGYYAEVGLAVEILPGGPGGRPIPKVAAGQVAFSMGRSDDIMLAVQEGLPVLIVAALMQHDPQAILLHADHPVNALSELDGHAIMAYPGSAWIPYLKKRYDIEIDLLPMSYGLARFAADPNLIQACFVTDEPFRLEQQGTAVKTLLLSDSGYDPYRVIVAHGPFAKAHPQIVRAFVTASLRGWADYMTGDPSLAHNIIAAQNDHMTPEQMAFSHAEMIRRRFVTGNLTTSESLGQLDPDRLNRHAELLQEVGVLTAPLPLERYVTFEFLPPLGP
jgi:NitT/TauT family transport system substrate-binding protein